MFGCLLAFIGLPLPAADQAPLISYQPSSWQQYEGFSVSLDVVAVSDSPPGYQWFKDGIAIEGATQRFFGLPSVSAADNGSYWVEVTNTAGTTRSKTVTGESLPRLAPIIGGHPQGRQVDLHEEVALSAHARGLGSFTTSWKHNGEVLASGMNQHTLRLTIEDESQLGTYVAVISNEAGSAESLPAQLTLAPPRPPYFATHPVAMVVLRPGEFFEGIQASIATNRPGVYELLKDGQPVEGAFPATATDRDPQWRLSYTPIQPEDAGTYQLRFTNEFGVAESGFCEIIVSDAALPALISRTSRSQTAEGATHFSIQVETPAGIQPDFQWFHDGVLLPGAHHAELEFHNFGADQVGDYTVRVTTPWRTMTSAPLRVGIAAAGQAPYFVDEFRNPLLFSLNNVDLGAKGEKPIRYQWYLNGNPVSRNELRRADIGLEDILSLEATNRWGSMLAPPPQRVPVVHEPIVILYQPRDVTVDSGTSSISFRPITANQNQSGINYQWFKDGDAIPGATSRDLHISPVRRSDAGNYTVELSNDTGVVTSQPASLTVQPVEGWPEFTAHPASQTIGLGDAFTLSGQAEVNSRPLAYQWYRGSQPIAGATAATLTVDSAAPSDADFYFLEATGSAGAVFSEFARIEIPRPTSIHIESQPTSVAVAVGEPAEFTVEATSDSPLSYRWTDRLGRPVGEDAPTLIIPEAGAQEAGVYRVSISNATDTVQSVAAELIVELDSDFYFSRSPESVTVPAGMPFTLRAKAETATPWLSYSWYRDGVRIPNQTGANLTIEAAAPTDAGSYHVLATAFGPPIKSAVARVTVLPAATDIQFKHAAIGRSYESGETVTILNTVTYTGTLDAFTWSALLPEGVMLSAVESISGQSPPVGAVSLAEWTWDTVPASPFSFTYAVSPPTTGDDPLEIAALATWRRGAADVVESIVHPHPLVVPVKQSVHAADLNADHRLELSELLNMIELYNVRVSSQRTGHYDLFPDGSFRPAPALNRLPYRIHSGDLDRNGKIDLSELLRVIELYNTRSGTSRTGAYRRTDQSVDGFAPGTAE